MSSKPLLGGGLVCQRQLLLLPEKEEHFVTGTTCSIHVLNILASKSLEANCIITLNEMPMQSRGVASFTQICRK